MKMEIDKILIREEFFKATEELRSILNSLPKERSYTVKEMSSAISAIMEFRKILIKAGII